MLSCYPQVDKAVLYGSHAKGNYKNSSDIDLTLHGGPELKLNVLYRILDELDDLLLPYIIDLSIYDNIHDAYLIKHIQRVGVTFYDKSEVIPVLAARGLCERGRTERQVIGEQ